MEVLNKSFKQFYWMQYLISADIYNFMFILGEIQIDNWKLIPNQNSHDIYKRIKKEDISLLTGSSELYINYDGDFEQALDHGMNILNLYSKLLSFTENADVYFNNYRCYEIIDGEKIIKLRSYYPIRIRRPWGYTHFGYEELLEYLNKATKLILNEDFMEKTNIDRTMDWYTLAQSTNIFDTRLLLLFISLEIVANSWAKYNDKFYILNETEKKTLIKGVKKVLKKEMDIEKSLRKQVNENVNALNRSSIKNKTINICIDLEIELDVDELKQMIKLRNMIVHGDRIEYSSELFDYNEKLDSIIQNIVYTLVGVGENVGKFHFRQF